MSFFVRFDTVTPADPLGGKARALADLGAAGFPVPPWFVVTPETFEASVTPHQREAVASARRHQDVSAVLDAVSLAAAVESDLARELREITGDGQLVAVRSSAVDEDSVQHSFAGQLQSFLFVSAQDVASRIVDVWRSGFSERVFAYRREHDLPALPTVPAVLIQQMVDADVSGVAFSTDPVTGNRGVAVVGSLYGLGTALVSGEGDADTHYVGRDDRIVDRKIARKTLMHRSSPGSAEGVAAVAVGEDRAGEAALRDDQVIAISALARRAEKFFGRPQDIEWAIAAGRLYLLQSRPITSLADVADPDGALNIWDNSNIAESYGGITTPLTFSFARNAYEGVYRQLAKIFRVPDKRIEQNSAAFANMLGLIRGRVYYNLLNWYRLLTLLPGYQMNRAFLEQMIGVEEGPPKGVLGETKPAAWHARVADGCRLLGTVFGMVVNFFLLNRKVERFYRRVEDVLTTRGRDLPSLRPDQLVVEYQLLESRLITHWDAPLINDFFAMIFYGWLRRLCATWCGDATRTLQNDLLCGGGGMVSTEPARRIEAMAAMARAHPDVVDALCSGDTDDILVVLSRHDELRTLYESYLRKFGERCADELKLESSTLHEDPLMLLRSIGYLAQQPSDASTGDGATSRDTNVRARAEKRVRDQLGANVWRRMIFAWVLDNARRRVIGRENLRLERTRVFGRVRRIFVELGRRLHALDLIDDARDIFYLRLEEAIGFVEGTSATTNLKKLAALRKQEFEEYSRMEAPADRFETRGIVYQGNTFQSLTDDGQTDGDTRSGIGCCPGRVSGSVRVVLDPRGARLRQGDILVAERTDPSWIMLFPFAAGLLVERGNLLSHSAIVAREMGIPAVVSIAGVTRWLRDGDRVELDGTTGLVKKITAESAHDT
ncbi:MAG: PEP-utilizing enzyme [Candidatus Krumholzibacteria bacterium]|nr:PEP-utilizing enzyme [Candidatus Krumholzibacteria bacterium]